MVSKIKVDEIESSQAGGSVIFNSPSSKKIQTLTSSSGVLAINLVNGSVGTITLTENITDIDFTNVPSTGFVEFQLIITQHASSAKTVSFDKVTVNGGSEAIGLGLGNVNLAISEALDSVDICIFKFNNASSPFIDIEKKYSSFVGFPTFDNELFRLDAGDTDSYGGSGTTWTDLSAAGNDFTLSGFTWDSNGYFNLTGSADFYKTSIANVVSTLYMVLQTVDTQAIMWSDGPNESGSEYVGAYRSGNVLYHSNAGSPTTYVNDSTSTNLYADLVHSSNVRLVTFTGLTLSGWNNNNLYGGSVYGAYEFGMGGKLLAAGGFSDSLTSTEVVELHSYFKDTKGYVS